MYRLIDKRTFACYCRLRATRNPFWRCHHSGLRITKHKQAQNQHPDLVARALSSLFFTTSLSFCRRHLPTHLYPCPLNLRVAYGSLVVSTNPTLGSWIREIHSSKLLLSLDLIQPEGGGASELDDADWLLISLAHSMSLTNRPMSLVLAELPMAGKELAMARKDLTGSGSSLSLSKSSDSPPSSEPWCPGLSSDIISIVVPSLVLTSPVFTSPVSSLPVFSSHVISPPVFSSPCASWLDICFLNFFFLCSSSFAALPASSLAALLISLACLLSSFSFSSIFEWWKSQPLPCLHLHFRSLQRHLLPFANLACLFSSLVLTFLSSSSSLVMVSVRQAQFGSSCSKYCLLAFFFACFFGQQQVSFKHCVSALDLASALQPNQIWLQLEWLFLASAFQPNGNKSAEILKKEGTIVGTVLLMPPPGFRCRCLKPEGLFSDNLVWMSWVFGFNQEGGFRQSCRHWISTCLYLVSGVTAQTKGLWKNWSALG